MYLYLSLSCTSHEEQHPPPHFTQETSHSTVADTTKTILVEATNIIASADIEALNLKIYKFFPFNMTQALHPHTQLQSRITVIIF